jgi:hypothetical protein
VEGHGEEAQMITLTTTSPRVDGDSTTTSTTTTLWTWSPPHVSTDSTYFPGNRSDEQFVKQTSKDSRFSCEYTGRHDGGALPEQRRHPGHLATLTFLEQAREAATNELVKLMSAQKQQ